MYQEILKRISSLICKALQTQSLVDSGCVAEPQTYFDTIYRLESAVLGILYGQKLPTSSPFAEKRDRCSDFELDLLRKFKEWLKSNSKGLNASHLYELMLLLEFPVRNGQITENLDDLNSIGSFYTPKSLSDKIVELTLDNYLKQANTESEKRALLLNATIGDYSCGTGRFFISTIDYCKNRFQLNEGEIRQIVLNFSGIEADAISLEIARIQLCNALNDWSIYEQLCEQLVHGNPLFEPTESGSELVFCNENYYLNQLAIRKDSIQKCDIILANPPWGEVELDLQFYFHLLCPHLNETEDEEQLALAVDQLSETHPELYNWLIENEDAVDEVAETIYDDERFQNSTINGLQTNLLFTELCNSLKKVTGTAGFLLKGSTLSDPKHKRLVDFLQSQNRIAQRYDFKNSNNIINIDSEETFTILILSNSGSALHRENLASLDDIYR